MHAIPWSEFTRAHSPLTREEFLAVVQVPHLLIPWLETEDEADPFYTERFTRAELFPGAERPKRDLLLAPLKKREEGGNAFTGMITLGRAANNDLVLPHPGVSKFHAYFRQQDGKWTIKDANSLNGTRVDTDRLGPEQERRLEPGAVIRLADAVTLEFLPPEDLFQRLRSEEPLSGAAREQAAQDALPPSPADPSRATRIMPRGPLSGLPPAAPAKNRDRLDPDEETHPLAETK